MRLSIDVLYKTHTNLDVPLSTIALIRGNALGAGFEGALSCDYLVAEKSVQLGFPEVLFNMFPGMGAYSFLSRRINTAQVEKMILSGRIYSAQELYEMGVVDVVAEDGDGINEINKFIKILTKNKNTRSALLKIRHRVNPVSLKELLDIGEIWVDRLCHLVRESLRQWKDWLDLRIEWQRHLFKQRVWACARRDISWRSIRINLRHSQCAMYNWQNKILSACT
jgi:DSF synthase